MISVVFPAYNEESNVEELHRRLKAVMDGLGTPYEIVAVDDGSRDHTRERLSTLRPIKLVVFTRNYGQNAALDAGLRTAKGDIVVTIDSDLQNPPEEIPRLVKKLGQGFDVVVGWRRARHDRVARRVFSRLANRLVALVTRLTIHDFSCALKVYRREFIADVKLLGETFIFLPVFAQAQGARIAEVEIAHEPRRAGRSKHTIGEMMRVVFDLITVKFLLAYFGKPMRFFGSWALVSWGIAGVAVAWAITLKLLVIRNFSETPLPIIATLFVIMGVLLFMLGFLAEILLRIYHEAGRSSPYAIKEIIENE